jgi:hypothetical protein
MITSIPSGAARVAITSIVCGNTSAATPKRRELLFADAHAERHCFGRCGRLVEHRRVGDGHAGHVRDHRLEVDERLEAALRDLRLVRRIRRVPRGILEDVPLDHARRVRAVVTLADERLEDAVLARDGAKARERLGLRERLPDRHRFLRRIAGGTTASIRAERDG